MPSAQRCPRRLSRRRALALLSAPLIGAAGGCLSESSDLDRDLPLAFVRLVNQSRAHERTFDVTLSRDDDLVVDESYEGVPPARAPMSLLISSGGPLQFGTLPGGTGVDTDQFERQLPVVHTIVQEPRARLDKFELTVTVSPGDATESFGLWEQLSDFEGDGNRADDGSLVGVSVECGNSITTKFHVFESSDDKALLEEFLAVERARQSHREEFGAQTVEDSPFS